MKIKITILLFCFTVLINAQTWKLIWSDEFDAAAINPFYWTYDIGGSGWGNNELEYYTNRSENSKIENGNLLIIAKKESYGGNAYTSARLKTQGLQNFTYGKIESRIKLPMGKGIWPAFWMLGKSITSVGWPKCGEIDIMEHINTEIKVYGTMHWDNNGHASYGGSTVCLPSDYHIYSLEWSANYLRWFVDGNKFWEGNITNGINSTDEFQQPFFIILNLAVGGNWPGNPDATTTFPDTMAVDYVRVYQSVTGIQENKGSETPTKFLLEQNYPNPFNPVTTINYSIPHKSFVSLSIYDLLGREVSSMVNQEQSPGNYSVKYDGSNLSSGIYFCKIRAGNYTDTKKIVLMK